MRSVLPSFCMLFFLFSGVSYGADALARWNSDHSEARKKLAHIIEANPKFHEDFTACVEENPKLMNEYIEFLAAKGDRNTNDFVEKAGKEAHLLKRLHERHEENVRAFRVWIRDYDKAATDLAQIKDGLKRVCKGDVPTEREEAHDNRNKEKEKNKDKDHEKEKKKKKD